MGSQVVKEVEILEDHAHLCSEGAQVLCILGIQGVPLKNDLPLVRGNEAVDALQERAFACTGRTDEHLELTAGNVQAAVLEDILAAKALADVFNFQNYFLSCHLRPP